MSKWFTDEEMERLRKNPAVWRVCEATIVINEMVYEGLFEDWHENGIESLEKNLEAHGLLDALEGTGYIAAMLQEFRMGIHSRFHGNADNAINAALVASGYFKMGKSTVKWLPEIRKALIDRYPEESFEEGIRKLGLTAEIVGVSRLNSLKQTVIREFRKQEHAERMLEQVSGDGGDEIGYLETDAYIYMKHPYVQEVVGKGKIVMSSAFYNEAKSLTHLPVDQVLKMYEIDSSLLKGATISGIQQALLLWETTDESQTAVDDQVIRIQVNRLKALTGYSDELFSEIRKQMATAKPSEKKQLCRQISEYPTVMNYAYGYSMLESFLSHQDEKGLNYHVKQACRMFGVSRSGYYSWKKNREKLASKRAADELKEQELIQSCSRRGNSRDNAPMESFFGSMKCRIMDIVALCTTYEDAAKLVMNYIDAYNNEHYRYELAGLTPAEYYIYVTTGLYPCDDYYGVKPGEMMTVSELVKQRMAYAEAKEAKRREHRAMNRKHRDDGKIHGSAMGRVIGDRKLVLRMISRYEGVQLEAKAWIEKNIDEILSAQSAIDDLKNILIHIEEAEKFMRTLTDDQLQELKQAENWSEYPELDYRHEMAGLYDNDPLRRFHEDNGWIYGRPHHKHVA